MFKICTGTHYLVIKNHSIDPQMNVQNVGYERNLTWNYQFMVDKFWAMDIDQINLYPKYQSLTSGRRLWIIA